VKTHVSSPESPRCESPQSTDTSPAASGSNSPQPSSPYLPPSEDATMAHCSLDNGEEVADKGFRDDLKHREDQDKNGNMKDGDNVGAHSPG
jgi:hypothetical protein